MSVVIASKFNNGVILASDRQVTHYGNKIEDKVNKITKVENIGTSIGFGGVGILRELQQLFKISSNIFNSTGIKRNGLTTYECIEALNKITPEFRENLFIEANQVVKHLYGDFIAADPYNIHYIGGDLAVISDLDYFAVGSGEDLVMGHLNVAFKDKNPEKMKSEEIIQILKDSIQVSCKDVCSIDDNIDFIVLYKDCRDLVSDSEIEIITRCELDVVNKKALKTKKECSNNCKECPHNMRIVFSKKDKTIRAISN